MRKGARDRDMAESSLLPSCVVWYLNAVVAGAVHGEYGLAGNKLDARIACCPANQAAAGRTTTEDEEDSRRSLDIIFLFMVHEYWPFDFNQEKDVVIPSPFR